MLTDTADCPLLRVFLLPTSRHHLTTRNARTPPCTVVEPAMVIGNGRSGAVVCGVRHRERWPYRQDGYSSCRCLGARSVGSDGLASVFLLPWSSSCQSKRFCLQLNLYGLSLKHHLYPSSKVGKGSCVAALATLTVIVARLLRQLTFCSLARFLLFATACWHFLLPCWLVNQLQTANCKLQTAEVQARSL